MGKVTTTMLWILTWSRDWTPQRRLAVGSGARPDGLDIRSGAVRIMGREERQGGRSNGKGLHAGLYSLYKPERKIGYYSVKD